MLKIFCAILFLSNLVWSQTVSNSTLPRRPQACHQAEAYEALQIKAVTYSVAVYACAYRVLPIIFPAIGRFIHHTPSAKPGSEVSDAPISLKARLVESLGEALKSTAAITSSSKLLIDAPNVIAVISYLVPILTWALVYHYRGLCNHALENP